MCTCDVVLRVLHRGYLNWWLGWTLEEDEGTGDGAAPAAGAVSVGGPRPVLHFRVRSGDAEGLASEEPPRLLGLLHAAVA